MIEVEIKTISKLRDTTLTQTVEERQGFNDTKNLQKRQKKLREN